MNELPIVDFVRLDNGSPIADSVVETRLRDIEIGEPLDVDARRARDEQRVRARLLPERPLRPRQDDGE